MYEDAPVTGTATVAYPPPPHLTVRDGMGAEVLVLLAALFFAMLALGNGSERGRR